MTTDSLLTTNPVVQLRSMVIATTWSLIAVLLSAMPLHGQTGSENEPVRYVGGVTIDPRPHEARLRPVIGVHTHQVMRANRSHPEWSDGHGWTYNHAPDLAGWNGRFDQQYFSNPVGEHIPPGQTLLCTSENGSDWNAPSACCVAAAGPGRSHSCRQSRPGW